MISANPGNLLKFSTHAAWQRHNQAGQNLVPFGLKCPVEKGLPFQIFKSSGAGVVTWKLVNPLDPTGGIFEAMDAGDLVITNKAGGGFWVTRTAFVDLTNPVDCGFWEAWVTIDGTVHKSEVMHFQELTDPIYRIRFTHSGDKGDVLYSAFSYHQFLYVTKWAWDRPTSDKETEESVDGNNNVTILFSRTVTRFRLEVADIPDFAIPFLEKIKEMDGVQFEDMAGALPVVPMVNTDFSYRQQGNSLNVGVFTFDAEIESFSGCQPNFETA